MREHLIERIERASPRMLLIVSGPGWGKTFLADMLVAAAGPSVVCRFRDALDPAAARRAASPLLDRSPHAEPLDLVVLDECERLAGDAGKALLEELVAAVPRGARIAVLSRTELPLDVSRFAAPHEVLTLRNPDLAFTPDQCRALIGHADLPRSVLDRAIELCRGWPVAALLFARIAREGSLPEALSDLSGSAFGDLHRYLAQQAEMVLDDDEFAVVIAAVAEPGATARELGLAIGGNAAAAIDRMTARVVMFLVSENERYSIVPLVSGAVMALYGARVASMRRNLALALQAEGAFVRAARLWLASGDAELACRALDAAGRHLPNEIIGADYDEVARALPLEIVFASRNVFGEFFNNRRTRAMPDALHERVSAFCDGMSLDLDPSIRYSARIALFLTLQMTLKKREADAVARECLVLSENFPEAVDRKKLLLAEYAANSAWLGAFARAHAIWDQHADDHTDRGRYEFQRFITDFNRLLAEGRTQELNRALEANVERARLWNEPIVLVHALAFRSIARIVSDPGADVGQTIADMEALLGEGAGRENTLSATHRFIRALERAQPFSTPSSCLMAIDAALGQNDPETARTLIEAAIAGFDRMGMPFWQIVARLATATLPGARRTEMLQACVALAGDIDAPALRTELEELAAGRPATGPLAAIRRRLAGSALMRKMSLLSVNLIDCTVTRGEEVVPIRHREFDLLIVLALSASPLSVEQICEQIWPDAHEEAATAALRMTVHRLRKQLGQSDAVLSVPAGYTLNAGIAVDLVEAERTLRATTHLPFIGPAERAKLDRLFARVMDTTVAAYERFGWYEALERRISQLRFGLGTLLARQDLKDGAIALALERAHALLQLDPLDEPAVELVVRAYLAGGDASAAAREWRRYVQALDREYGTEPSIDLSGLFRAALLTG